MESLRKIAIATVIVVVFSLLTGCYITAISPTGQYSNPSWAPDYYSGARYYYIPDIEAYYDLSDQDFVYLDNGQWLFSYGLPPIYSEFDLYNAYIVVLNVDVYQPWMHHHLYVSNYPRFYYRSMYPGDDNRNVKSFNENDRKPLYWTKEDRIKVNGLRNKESSEKKSENTRSPQRVNYRGKNIGAPVKVQQQMREKKQATPVKVQQKTREKNQGNQIQKRRN